MTRSTVRQVFDEYLRRHSMPRRNEVSDRRNMRAPLEAFGDRRADLVNVTSVERFIRYRAKGGTYSPKPVAAPTIKREITALQAVLNWGSRKGLIPGSPVYRFEKPSESAPRDRWLTAEQEANVASALTTAPLTVRLFTKLGLTYGARSGAIMDLHFGPQVNFQTGIVDFNVPGRPRSRKRRTVAPMTASVRIDLGNMLEIKGECARVCDWNTPYLFRRFMTSIGYPWVTPHVLKHTAITAMLREGVAPGDVAKVTSTDLRTIHSVYRHHTVGELEDIVEARGI